MANPSAPPLLLLLSTFLLSHAAPHSCSIPHDSSSTLRILHAFGPCSPLSTTTSSSSSSSPWWSSLLSQDNFRLLYLSSLAATTTSKPTKKSSVPIASGRSLLQTTTYLVRLQLGTTTPPQPLLLASLDTSSDASWFPCSSCSGCPSSSAIYSPSSSPSYSPLPCSSPLCSQFPSPSCSSSTCLFNLTYGGAALSAAASQDTISLANNNIPNFAFGCLKSVTGATTAPPPQGVLGLGRGRTSFMSQSQSLYSSTFSYCLPSFRSLNFSGSLRLGPVGQPKRIKTTPLLTNPRRRSLYYANMTGILIGRKRLAIPPAALGFDPSTGAGTVFDAGTMFTRLVAPAYVAVRDEFRRRMNGPVTSLGGFDTCYDTTVVASVPPSVTFEFDGMSVTLPPENVMIHSTAGSTVCLAMAAAPENVNSVLNVIASMQQQNHRVLMDGVNGRIGVARELCT